MKDDRLYLKHILDSINLIFKFIENQTFNEFTTDIKTQSAVIRQLEIIGEASNNLGKELILNNKHIPWSQIIATRNKLIHEYFGVDTIAIWGIIEDHLTDLKKNIEVLINELE